MDYIMKAPLRAFRRYFQKKLRSLPLARGYLHWNHVKIYNKVKQFMSEIALDQAFITEKNILAFCIFLFPTKNLPKFKRSVPFLMELG
jgi:hypothetical protein